MDNLPSEDSDAIRKTNEIKMRKIMDLMKVRIHYFKDMEKHLYFWKEPEYNNKMAFRFLRKLKVNIGYF